MRDLVEADEGEGIPVDVAKTGGDVAPHRCLLAEQAGRRGGRRRRGLVFDPPEPRRADEADALSRPLLEPAGDVGGDENDLRGAADELVFDGPRSWGDEGEDGGAVGRGDGDPALAGLEAGVDDEPEAELVEVEVEAPVEVVHEDPHGMDAEEGRGDIRAAGHGGPMLAEPTPGAVRFPRAFELADRVALVDATDLAAGHSGGAESLAQALQPSLDQSGRVDSGEALSRAGIDPPDSLTDFRSPRRANPLTRAMRRRV